MESTMAWPPSPPATRWRELVMPKEHGSWSLAFEPLALGLLVAPSFAGGFLAASVAASFFARRPLRILATDARPERRAAARRALAALAALAGLAFGGVLIFAGANWLGWLVPSVIAGVLFLVFDLRQAGRAEGAEVAGAAAFGWLPAVFAVVAGAPSLTAVAVAAIMIGRVVPTVLCLRAALRAAKTGRRRDAPALIAAVLALGIAIALVRADAVPFTAVAFFALFALRAFGLLIFPRPALRGRTLGISEAVLGALFVVLVGCTWTW